MWMGYSETRHPLPGPRRRRRPDRRHALLLRRGQSDSDTKFPQFYDGQWFIGEWNNDWIKTATLNNQGLATGVACFARLHGLHQPDGHGVRSRRLAVRRRVGPGLQREQPRLRRLPGRLHPGRALSRSPTRRSNNDAVPGRHDGQLLVRRLQRSGRHEHHLPVGLRRRHADVHRGEPVAHLHGGRHLRRDADRHRRVRRLARWTRSASSSATSGRSSRSSIPENGKVADFGDKVAYKVSVDRSRRRLDRRRHDQLRPGPARGQARPRHARARAVQRDRLRG